MAPTRPSLDEVRAIARSLIDPSLIGKPRADLLALVERLMEDHPLIVSKDPRPPTLFWRGRKAPAEGFKYLREMMEPPTALCTTYNRCSGPGQSMVYAAMTLHTVFSEVRATAGEHVQVVVIAPKGDCKLQFAHIGEIDHWRRYGRSIESNPRVAAYLGALFPNPDWSEIDVRRMFVDAFMADLFSRDGGTPGIYEVTSAIADRYLAAGMDGIAYPSVQHRGGLNIALHPRCQNEMGVSEFGLYAIEEDLDYGLFKKRFVKDASSYDLDGLIKWNSS